MKKTKINLNTLNGITLVSLIISIIILLILSGISINILFGNNSILYQATKAKEEAEIQLINEKRQLAMLNANMNTHNYTYIDKNGETAIIPAGFAPTEIEDETNIETGLVIIDAKGNEFVYVPINDINTMSQCEFADGTCHLVLNTNQNLICDTHNSSSIVGKLYAYGNGEDFGTANTQYISNKGIREPATITGSTSNEVDAGEYNLANFASYNEMLESLKKEYKSMAESIAKNGGFYIARYETSLSNNNIVSSQYGLIPITAKLLKNSWYEFYTISKGLTNNYITSSMIWGSQYDATLNWAKSGKDSNKVSDINGIGNNSSGSISGSGTYDNDSINNIKDMGGNLLEWTLEASGQYHRIRRGGNYKEIRSPAYRWTDGVKSTSDVLRK